MLVGADGSKKKKKTAKPVGSTAPQYMEKVTLTYTVVDGEGVFVVG